MKENKEYRLLGNCKWCDCQVFGTHRNKLNAHQQWCKKNPKIEENKVKAKLAGKLGGQKVKDEWQKIKQSEDWLEYHERKHLHTFKCKNCEKDYDVELTNEFFDKHIYSEFCSSYCAHSYSAKHVDPENISKGMAQSEKVKQTNLNQRKFYICKHCKKQFYFQDSTVHSRSFCSLECKKQFWKEFYSRPDIGGKRHGSGRGKHGWYKGYYCDSSWELAWVIYQLDHNVKFKRYTKWFSYEFNEQQRKYFPDFLMEDGSFVEIKGYNTLEWQAKLNSFPKDLKLKVYYKEDLKPIFDYVVDTYGYDWIYMYDDSKPKPIKDYSKQKFVWFHKDGKNTMVNPEKIQQMLDDGWEFHRIKHK